jgi:hypothetical protein
MGCHDTQRLRHGESMNPTPTPTLRAGASADSGAGGHTTDDHRVNTVRTWWGLLDEWIPTGRRLSDARWPQRHQAVVWVLWLHLPVLGAVGLLTGDDPVHVVGGVGLLAAGAVIAGSRRSAAVRCWSTSPEG